MFLPSYILIFQVFFGYGGWRSRCAGFKVIKGKLDISGVVECAPVAIYFDGLCSGIFCIIVIGTISFMVSVLVKSTAASIGIMMSTLIGGTILSYFIADWKFTRYLFMVNLRLTDYLSGSVQPIEGINMIFSVLVLLIWAIGALAVSFIRFTKQDILV